MDNNEFYKDLYQKGMDILLEKVEAWERAYNELEEDFDDLIEKNKELTKELREYKEQHDSEHKFKVGDEIRFVGELDSDKTSKNDCCFTEGMSVLLDGKARKILNIEYYNDEEFKADIEGVENLKVGCWCYHEDDFEKVE